jgi:3-oxoacyl-[acyl-carrier protein] reductase
LAREGFEIVLNYRAQAELAEGAAAEIRAAGGAASTLCFDVSERRAARAALEAELAERGPFWGVVLNAGVHDDAAFAAMADEQWDRVLATNLDAFHIVLQPLIMPMVRLRDGGRIVTLGSVSGTLGTRGQANYAASKAGLASATRSLALELAKRSITANCVAPGFIATDMLQGLAAEELGPSIPMKRLGRAEEVAALVAFLFGEEAGYITGQTLAIDGGLS